jgi:predicted nucleotidyltransferase
LANRTRFFIPIGLISIKVIGNKKLYQANKDSPLFDELQSMALKTFGLADVLKEALTPIANQIKVAFVYGSIAKREDTSKSDIDVLFISDTLSYADLFSLLAEPQEKLGREINPSFYSEENWVKKMKANNNFVTKIIEQPKIFLIGSADELSELK